MFLYRYLNCTKSLTAAPLMHLHLLQVSYLLRYGHDFDKVLVQSRRPSVPTIDPQVVLFAHLYIRVIVHVNVVHLRVVMLIFMLYL